MNKKTEGNHIKNEIKGENVDAKNRGSDCRGKWKNFAS